MEGLGEEKMPRKNPQRKEVKLYEVYEETAS